MKTYCESSSDFAELLERIKNLDYTGYAEQYPLFGSWRPFGKVEATISKAWKTDAGHGSELHLFVNFPFCRTKCEFCFLPVTGTGDNIRSARSYIGLYLDRLYKEASFYSPLVRKRRCVTLYIGGGTPSMMTPAEINRFFFILRSAFNLSATDQIALEIHPESATLKKMETFAANGVNWTCVGVQSLDQRVLKSARRPQRLLSVKKAVRELRAAGIAGVNLDLICGLPGQTEERFMADVRAAAALRPDEIHLNLFVDTPYTLYALRGGGKIDSEAVKKAQERGFSYLCAESYLRIDSDAAGLTRLSRNLQTTDLAGKKSILGLGPGAVSRAWGAARYINTIRWSTYASDLAAGHPPVKMGVKTNTRDEMIYYALDKFTYGRRVLDFRAFREIFGCDFLRLFPCPARKLLRAGAEISARGLKAGPGLWLAARRSFYEEKCLRAAMANLRQKPTHGAWPP